jgi:hypothetical protein
MPEDDLHTDHRAGSGAEPHQDLLEAENVSLRLLLEQAEINTRSLLAKAGIDAREREASDKLQKLILEELHHRIKNTLATVGAIVSQSLRNLPGVEHAQHAIEGRLTRPRARPPSAGKMDQRRSWHGRPRRHRSLRQCR